MKVTYIKLENVAGLLVGSNINKIEISFEKSKNTIVSIQGANGIGKSVLLSSISPFSGVTSVDERSTLSYIIPKKDGYKEIHYQIDTDKYIIKHYYKATKDTHTVKSYFNKNGEELNENGNVKSFLSLVETYFGLTEEMMRLIRLGTNVDSFIKLTPARRKEYVGKLIDEIDAYLIIYKSINEDLRVVKTLISNNNANLYKCHISDLIIEENNLSDIEKEINKHEKEKEKIIKEIGKIQALMNKNSINDLQKKRQDLESSLRDLQKTEDEVKRLSLEKETVDSLIKIRSNLLEEKINIQSKINSYRISIDNSLKQIERLELSIKKVTSNNDIQSLINTIQSIKTSIDNVSDIIKSFNLLGSSSEIISQMVSKLISFNQISQMIYTFGNRPVNIFLKLKQERKSIDKFLKDQMKKSISRIDENDVKNLLNQVFGNDDIISPNCSTEFEDCPYYRLSEAIYGIKDKLEEESYDDETLRYIQIISNNIDNILNEIDYMKDIKIPDILRNELNEEVILRRIDSRLPFFDISKFQEYLSLLKEYELYQENLRKLKEYEYQLSIYKKSGIDNQMSEIKSLRESISFYKNNIDVLNKDINNINLQLNEIDSKISLLTKYQDGKKYQKMFESSLESTIKTLEPLETAASEKTELEFSLRQVTNLINLRRQNHRELEMKINEYKRLVKEGKELDVQYKDLTRILETVSTKKGIPVIYMKKYLGKIKKLANNLLNIIYGDNLKLAKFNVTPDTFEVPYIKNGIKISDIKYASQSEVALTTMALSFALANRASGNYNILLLDEIDSGLDESNRSAFLKMLYMQMNELKAEQVFIISQNMNQMINVPMDCIKLSDIGIKSKLQNIIYEAS